MEKFNNKYRIPSARLQNWDYRWTGAYFITICTQNRLHYFGEIVNQQMKLSNIGVIADLMWYQIPHHTKNVELHSFIVMPNHIHGILIIKKNGDDSDDSNDTDVVSHHMAKISPKSNSISTIIRSYKSAVTKHSHRLGYEFQWQTRFHDHIIRDDKSFQNISDYIQNNPANWDSDKFFKSE